MDQDPSKAGLRRRGYLIEELFCFKFNYKSTVFLLLLMHPTAPSLISQTAVKIKRRDSSEFLSVFVIFIHGKNAKNYHISRGKNRR